MNRYFIFYPIPRDPSCLAGLVVNLQMMPNQFQRFLSFLFLALFYLITETYILGLMGSPIMAEDHYG